MGPVLRQVPLVIASMLLSSYYACQEVTGIALKYEEGLNPQIEDLDTSAILTPVEGNKFRTENGTVIELFPVSAPHLEIQLNSSRRRLGDFLSCGNCKCCDAKGANCGTGIRCCFNIRCDGPIFGVCKFVPFQCTCTACGI